MELFDAAAEDKGKHLKIVGDRRVLVRGDRDLLFDAIANLVDNAIKYGREAGQVIVEVKMSDGGATISVADDGPGIPVDEYPQRLQTLLSARTKPPYSRQRARPQPRRRRRPSAWGTYRNDRQRTRPSNPTSISLADEI